LVQALRQSNNLFGSALEFAPKIYIEKIQKVKTLDS
jgi:hypothetical protein